VSDAVYCFDVDDCLEIGGQVRLPSAAGPVTIASVRAQVADGDVCGIVGNWMNLPAALPDWREVFSFLLPPNISGSPKAFWLAWVRQQYPGRRHYVMVGNNADGHDNRPRYWDQQYPGSLPVTHVPGDPLLSNDYRAAAQAGFEFVKEDQWAAGQRTGPIPPPAPQDPFYSFPKGVRLPMRYKTFHVPAVLKADDAKGIVEALVSITANIDLQNEVIDPGAWRKVVESGNNVDLRMPRAVADHRWSAATTLGRTLKMEEWMPGDPRLPEPLKSKGYGGLWVRGQFNLDKQLAREVYSDLKGGFLDEFSVGFDVDTDEKGAKCEGRDGDGPNHIKSIFPLYEWSVVFMGANTETQPVAVKSADPEEGDGEMTEAAFEALSEADQLTAYYETFDEPEDTAVLLAQWSRAFINKLPDSSFALILPGGQKDSTGRTAPRSLRKLPHHGPGGTVDKPHLANALSRAAQQPALKKAIPHLRKHANAIGMGKDVAEHFPDIVTDHVPESTLKTLGAAVGAAIAAGYVASQRQHPT
jgi:HK97 family phage prohead protease